jgi:hypothetical protein
MEHQPSLWGLPLVCWMIVYCRLFSVQTRPVSYVIVVLVWHLFIASMIIEINLTLPMAFLKFHSHPPYVK